MRRKLFSLSIGALLVAAGFMQPVPVAASPWMFSRSNYSHTPPVPQTLVPVDPRVLGGPLYNYPRGDYLRGSYRVSRTQVNIRGRTLDTTYHWESWVQGGSQY